MPENTIYASDDTYISSSNSTTNYDTSEIVGIGYDKYITLLKFDLSSYIGNSYTINSATLYIYPDIIEADSTNEISIKSTTTDWDSDTVTWDTEPSYSTNSESETLGPEDAWNDLDITNLIQSICDEDINYYGLAIFDEVDNSYSNDINSSEHPGSYTPYLVIDYSLSGTQTQKSITVSIDGSINKTTKVKKILDVNIENSIVKLNYINKDIDLNLDNSSLITKSSTKIFSSTIELSTNILTPLKKVLELISYIDLNNAFIKNAKINISQPINLSNILAKKGFLSILSSISSVNNKTMKTTKNIIDLASIEVGINLRNIYRKILNTYFNILEFRSNKVLKTNNSNIDLNLVMFKNNCKYINLETDLVSNINKNNNLFLTNSFVLSLNISLRIKKTITQLINSSLNFKKKIFYIIESIVDALVNVQKSTSNIIYQNLSSFLDVDSNNLKKIKKTNNINVFFLTELQKKTQLSLYNFFSVFSNYINKVTKVSNYYLDVSNNNLKKISLNRIINLNLFILLNKKINKVTDVTIEAINAITLLPHYVFYKTITSNILLSSSKKNKIKIIIVGNLSTLTDVIKKMNKSINEFIGIVSNYINSNTIFIISRYVYYSETINKIFNTEIKNAIFNTEIKNAIFYYGDDGMDSFTKQSSEKFKIELNFEASLETGETISSYDLTIYNVRNQSEIDVTSSVSESPSNDDSSVYVTIKNGTNGYWYKITGRVTTTKGNIYEKDVLFNVQEK